MSNVTDPLGWDSTIWDPIQKAVHDETQRTKIAQQIIPIHGPLTNVTTVSSDITEIDKNGNGFRINEGVSVALVETSVKFALTKTQVSQEKEMSTGVMLATKAANVLSQAQDQYVFQGSINLDKNLVDVESNGNNGKGLLGDKKDDPRTTITVKPIGQEGKASRYGENTFAAVADGIATLQNNGHYGAYALVLNFEQYADTFAPLKDSLVMPADRIKPLLVDKGFFGTGAIPSKQGVLFSLAGDTMDLTVGVDAKAEFRSPDSTMYKFRVFERYALRLKDKTAVIKLDFQ